MGEGHFDSGDGTVRVVVTPIHLPSICLLAERGPQGGVAPSPWATASKYEAPPRRNPPEHKSHHHALALSSVGLCFVSTPCLTCTALLHTVNSWDSHVLLTMPEKQ